MHSPPQGSVRAVSWQRILTRIASPRRERCSHSTSPPCIGKPSRSASLISPNATRQLRYRLLLGHPAPHGRHVGGPQKSGSDGCARWASRARPLSHNEVRCILEARKTLVRACLSRGAMAGARLLPWGLSHIAYAIRPQLPRFRRQL